MKFSLRPWMALAVLLAGAPAARANDMVTYSELESILARYEQRITDLESRSGGYGDGCLDACPTQCHVPGIVASAEIAFLRPHNTMGIRGFDNTALRYDYTASPRFMVGYQNAEGVGIRGRYWQFDNSTRDDNANTPGQTAQHGHDVWLLDVEIYNIIPIGHVWEVTASGGIRYGEFSDERMNFVTATGIPVGAHEFSVRNFGPMLGTEFRRRTASGVNFYSSLRGAILFGDQQEFLNGVEVARRQDALQSIIEFQLGAEYEMPLASGALLQFRGGYEGQHWAGFVGQPGGPLGDGNEAVGFDGFFFSIGLAR